MPVARRDEWGQATTRRGVLGGMVVAVAGAAGCRLVVPVDRKGERKGAPLDPDVVVTMRALAAEQALLDAYARVARRHPSLAKRLAGFRRRHTAHRDALHARLPVDASGRVVTPTPIASARPKASASPSATVADTLPALVAAERAAAADRVTDALDASPTLAEVLASIGACEAAHVDLLGELKA